MPYQITKADADLIANAMEEYYNEAWQAGIKNLMNRVAHKNMGLVTGYIDTAKDTWANLRKKSSDSFKVTFKSDLKLQVGLYFANKFDVMSDLVTIGEKAVDKLASYIPVPHLGSVLTAATGFAAGKARDELHNRSITEADKLLIAQSDAELQKMFSNDKETIEFVEKTMKQYKTLTNYISLMPTNVTNFDDAVTFPKSAFKIQQAASSLNVALWSIRMYTEAMSERLVECQKMSQQYIAQVRSDMPTAVMNVVQEAYRQGELKGQGDLDKKKYAAPPSPKLVTKPGGGATMLANRMAHAMAQGYYDVGNKGPMLTSAPHKAPVRPGMR